MGSFEQFQTFPHGAEIKRAGDMKRVQSQIRRLNPAGKDRILILFAGGGEPGVK